MNQDHRNNKFNLQKFNTILINFMVLNKHLDK